jgi:hypothetical protein
MLTPPAKPSELCRFRSFAAEYKDGKDEPEVYDLLRGRLRFSEIEKFNDPFEARPQIVAAYSDPSKQKWAMRQYLEDVGRRSGAADPKSYAVTRFAGKSTQEVLDEFADLHAQKHMLSVSDFYVYPKAQRCLHHFRGRTTPIHIVAFVFISIRD